jgi:hypothetical protein
VFLDTSGQNEVDWDEIAAILEDAFRYVAPKKLIAEFDNYPGGPSGERIGSAEALGK